jgi:hypothetical protein
MRRRRVSGRLASSIQVTYSRLWLKGEAGEVAPGVGVGLEGGGQVGGHCHLARLGVQLEVDVDLIPGGDPGAGAVPGVEGQEVLVAVDGHRAAVGVLADGDQHLGALGVAQGGHRLGGDAQPGRRLAEQLDGRPESHGSSMPASQGLRLARAQEPADHGDLPERLGPGHGVRRGRG